MLHIHWCSRLYLWTVASTPCHLNRGLSYLHSGCLKPSDSSLWHLMFVPSARVQLYGLVCIQAKRSLVLSVITLAQLFLQSCLQGCWYILWSWFGQVLNEWVAHIWNKVSTPSSHSFSQTLWKPKGHIPVTQWGTVEKHVVVIKRSLPNGSNVDLLHKCAVCCLIIK